MTVPTLAALDAVATAGPVPVAQPAAEPTTQQIGRFEAQLQAADNYAAPAQGWLSASHNWHSAMSGIGQVAQSLRNEFAQAFQTIGPDELDPLRPMTLETAAHQMMQMMDHSTHMSFSAMNLQLIGDAERVTEQAGRTLYQQQE